MNLSEKLVEQKTIEAFKQCLATIPFVEAPIVLSQQDLADTTGLLATLKLPHGERRILIECKTTGQPRVARDAVNQLLRHLNKEPEAYGVFAAPYISPKAGRICTEEGIGYLDLAGNCHLSFGQVYIEKTGNPNPFSDKRELRSLYSAKASRILRVLLLTSPTTWRLQALAEEADVSLGLVFKVKKLLADREWIITETGGMRLTDPEALLTEWADNYPYRKHEVREYYSLKSITEMEAQIAEVLIRERIRYALTGFSGADRLAPFTRYHRVMAYLDETDKDLAQLLNLKKVGSGANVALVVPYDEGVFYGSRQINGVQIVSPIQLYLDLRSDRGRGEDAAKELMEQVIRPSW